MEKETKILNENETNDASFSKEENEKAGKKIDLKKVASGVGIGVAGVATGISGAMAAMAFTEDDGRIDPKPHEPAGTSSTFPDPSSIHMAHGVTDDMNFKEAFATAYHEVGTNGEFYWHGALYNTHLADPAAEHHIAPGQESGDNVEVIHITVDNEDPLSTLANNVHIPVIVDNEPSTETITPIDSGDLDTNHGDNTLNIVEMHPLHSDPTDIHIDIPNDPFHDDHLGSSYAENSDGHSDSTDFTAGSTNHDMDMG